MIILRLIHTILFYLLAGVSSVIGTTILLCFVPFAKQKNRPFLVAARIWSRFLIFFTGIKIRVSGLENIPRDKPVIIASNHQAAGDILLLAAFMPVPFRFAIKKELFKIPIFGWYLRKSEYLLIDRQLVLSAYKMVDAIADILKTGDSLLIFPEGTRTRTGELGKFKRGSLLSALKANVPVVPVAISGSYNIIPAGTWLINYCPVKLSVGKPIEIKSEADYNDKVEEVREAIARMLK
jgi:1-acyl-sn-glycerol-3-phosphate acyltransferase